MGYCFGLWAKCLNNELKKKICNDCHVASSLLVGEKKSHLSSSAEADTTWKAQEAGNAVRHTHTHTPANLRLRGSVVVAVVLLLQLRANTHTLKHRRADSSRPLER